LLAEFLYRRLDAGILVTQAGPLSVNQVHEICTPVAKTLGSVFPTVLTYGAHIPSFGHSWAYNIAFKQLSSLDVCDPEDVDAEIQHKLGAEMAEKLGWYDGLTHRSMFSLPKPVRAALAAETRVVTMNTPLAFVAGEGVRQLESKL
jgi:spermidine synthase